MSDLHLGSLCTGFGGLDLAVAALLDVGHAWHAEVDPAASRVLAAHWPDVPNLGDITNPDNSGPYGLPRCRLTAPRRARQAAKRHNRRVAGWQRQATAVDVLTGGIPCQPFSAAGLRLGTRDGRHLWPTGMLPAIEALHPRLVVLENVPGLLTIQRGQVFATVLADLDRLGYHVSWATVGACRVGACHHRHRVFLAATTVPVDPPEGALFGAPLASVRKWPQAGMVSGGLVWELPADVCGAADGVVLPTPTVADSRGSRNATAGRSDAAAPFEAGWTLSDLVYAGRIGNPAMLPTPTARVARRGSGKPYAEGRPLSEVIALLPTPRASDAAKGDPNQRGSSGDLMLPAAVQPGRFGAYGPAVARQEEAFGLPAPDPTEPGRLGRPRLSPQFCEWLLALPAGWITAHAGRNDSIRIAGNGVVWTQAAHALSTLPTVRAFLAARQPAQVGGAA